MDSITVRIHGPLSRADLPGLYHRLCGLLDGTDVRRIRCDVTGIAADAVALDALARLRLGARRRGAELELVGASPELHDLIALAGLDGVFRTRAGAEDRTAGTADRSTEST